MTANLGLFLLSAIGISLSGVMMPGPITAAIITKGYRDKNAGALIAIGHAVIEIPLIALIYLGFAHYFTSPEVKKVVGLVGGLMLIFMGVVLFRTMRKAGGERVDLPYNSVTTGIIMTGANPYFFLWWATVGTALIANATNFGILGLVLFGLVHWGCDLGWYQFISVSVFKSRHLWTPRVQKIVFGICAVILVGFGVWFCVSALF